MLLFEFVELDQRLPLRVRTHVTMAEPKPSKPDPSRRANKEVRQSEIRCTIKEYADDLREIIKKLRQKLN